jgi:hypothetical protein
MAETLSGCSCSYVIDNEDRLVDVDEAWAAFARANHGETVLPDRILGRPLWSFIAGMDNRLIYSRLLESVRVRPRLLSFPFRCDAPGIRRDFRMSVEPGPRRSIRFTSEVVEEQPRPAIRLLEAARATGDSVVLMCSWCMGVEVELRRWVRLEEADRYVASDTPETCPQVVHTICPACAEKIKSTIVG